MFFGIRLPGPFRVGISSKGRVYGGVRMGPFSVSSYLGGGQRPSTRRPPVWPVTLDAAAAEAQADGWTMTGHSQNVVLLRKGSQAAELRAVRGGVTVRRIASRRALIFSGILVVAVCGLCGACGLSSGSDPEPTAPVLATSAARTTPPTTPAASASASPTRTASPKPSPKRTTAKPKPSTDKRYATCKEANAAGLGPYVKGVDPEYAWYRDADGDGIVCERR